jgi:hypothetical protein
LRLEVLFTQAALETGLMAFFDRAGFVTRLGHLARFPHPIMFSAVTLANRLAIAIVRLASFCIGH